jgi:hypothetical protein
MSSSCPQRADALPQIPGVSEDKYLTLLDLSMSRGSLFFSIVEE